jgi:hypothetical protein
MAASRKGIEGAARCAALRHGTCTRSELARAVLRYRDPFVARDKQVYGDQWTVAD